MLLQRGDGADNSRRTVWLGQQFVDEDTMQDVKRVIWSTGIMTIIQVVMSLLMFFSGRRSPRSFFMQLLNFAMGMILPVCGFLGAKDSNAHMMCCFFSTSFVIMSMSVLAFLADSLTLWKLDSDPHLEKELVCGSSCRVVGCGNMSSICSCALGCSKARDIGCCPDVKEVCLAGIQQLAPFSCKELLEEFGPASTIFMIVLIVTAVPSILLSGYAGYHGRKLYKRLSAGDQLVHSGQRIEEQELAEVE
eukprot:TRINITY_DN101286_c0_g1_i1.p1 TRINITY_DN101286_c0_g1~~TRINITY_DN101286_c0_g1_i1.p1  ORF type:complete len:248 (+),score=40.88 TRINITY_DN101286_c0_g1_i1:25-768(+)